MCGVSRPSADHVRPPSSGRVADPRRRPVRGAGSGQDTHAVHKRKCFLPLTVACIETVFTVGQFRTGLCCEIEMSVGFWRELLIFTLSKLQTKITV